MGSKQNRSRDGGGEAQAGKQTKQEQGQRGRKTSWLGQGCGCEEDSEELPLGRRHRRLPAETLDSDETEAATATMPIEKLRPLQN